MRKIFFITIPSLFIFLIVMELGLRLYGYLYAQRYDPAAHAKTTGFSKDEFRILCLGDSFTFGMGADPEGSYPKQLEEILRKKNSTMISVINGGRLANTSSLLFKKIETNINKYSPSVIVVMIGLNNEWNLADSSYFFLNRKGMSFSREMERLLGSFRLYKLLKTRWDGLKSKGNVRRQKLNGIRLGQGAEERMSEAMSVGTALFHAAKYNLAVEKAKEVLGIDSTDYSARLLLSQALQESGEDRLAKEELWRAIHSINEWDADLVCRVIIQLERVDPGDELASFKKYFQTTAEKGRRDMPLKMIEASLDLRKNEKIFMAVLDYDLKQIAGLARKKGIKLVLMTYPSPDGGIFNLNGVIREASRKFHACLVDNKMAFEGKYRSEFFVADGHCTAKGYGLIAENVYNTLVKEKILPEGRTEIVTHGG